MISRYQVAQTEITRGAVLLWAAGLVSPTRIALAIMHRHPTSTIADVNNHYGVAAATLAGWRGDVRRVLRERILNIIRNTPNLDNPLGKCYALIERSAGGFQLLRNTTYGGELHLTAGDSFSYQVFPTRIEAFEGSRGSIVGYQHEHYLTRFSPPAEGWITYMGDLRRGGRTNEEMFRRHSGLV